MVADPDTLKAFFQRTMSGELPKKSWASILVLLQVAGALQCSLAELIGDVTTSSPEWLLIRELLEPPARERADVG